MEYEIFPQTIYKFDLSNHLKELEEVSKKLPYGPNEYNETSDKYDVLSTPKLKKVRGVIEDALKEILVKRGYPFELAITESWVNKTEAGGWHQGHMHPNSLISGVLYITESNSHTWFSAPTIWPFPSKNLPFYCMEPHVSEHGVIHKEKTSPGTLLIFPSNLWHSVDEHLLPDPRYTLSFNTFPEGVFGRPTSHLRCKSLPVHKAN